MFHTHAWLLWLVAALLPFTLTKNPYYLLLALGAVAVNYFVLARRTALGKSWGALLSLGITIALFSILYNVLFVTVGATKIATLPVLRLDFSSVVLQIGGAITLESLVYGAVNALSLIGILVVFATFNALADHYQLLRSAPRFLYQSAIVLSIALTFIPQMVAAQTEIRQAQLLRGHRFRAIRDLLPLFITLLAEGLESSITLAESMSARGFGSSGYVKNPPPTLAPSAQAQQFEPRGARTEQALQIAIALGLFALLCGAFAWTYVPNKLISGTLLVIGGGLVAFALWRIGSRVHVSRYRRVRWQRRDIFVASTSLVTILLLAAVWLTDSASFIFYPYPRLKPPEFDPLIALAILLIAAPALVPKLFPNNSPLTTNH